MIECTIKLGFFRRKVKFRFDLTALKAATVACYKDVGDFYTSKDLTDDMRFFYHCYGASLMGHKHTYDKLKRFSRTFANFKTKDVNILKATIDASNEMSEELKKMIKEIPVEDEKKN